MKTVITVLKKAWVHKSTDQIASTEAQINNLHDRMRILWTQQKKLNEEMGKLREESIRARKSLAKKVRGIKEYKVIIDGVSTCLVNGVQADINDPIVREAMQKINYGLKE